MRRGWWLVTAAAVVTAALTALGKVYTGAIVAGVVAAAGAVVAVMAERGRAQIAERAANRSKKLYVARVDEIDDPIRLGVHRAARREHADGSADQVPPFVPRDRLPDLEKALRLGGFVLVVGDSTAGKTRLAYEAMRVCLPRHVCVRPVDPAALAAGIDAAKQKRRSVLWLDDLDQYLSTGGFTRSDLDKLGTNTVVLATLRTHLRDEFSARYDNSRPPSERLTARAGREVLDAVTTEIRLDRTWSPTELAAARQSSDPRVTQAAEAADRHGIAETMAAGPQLLRDWHDAWAVAPRPADRTHGDPRGAALVSAAVDVRRAGYHRPLQLELLQELHEVYLAERGGRRLQPGTWENALDWATKPLHATSSLIDPETYQAFDYLINETVQDPHAPPVPEATWRTLLEQLAPQDLVEVAWRAAYAGHVRYIEPAFHRALASGHYHAAADLAESLDDAGQSQAPDLLELTISQAEDKDGVSAHDILAMRHSLAWMLGEQITGHGDPVRALGIVRRVIADGESLLGRTHPNMLGARLTLARQLGASGEHQEALDIATELVALATDLKGPKDQLTLEARFEAATWTRRLRGHAAGAELFSELLQDAQSGSKVVWSFILDTAWNLGGALVMAGDAEAALPILDHLVSESERAYGRKHAKTLPYRITRANAIGAAGDPGRARELTAELVADSARILGATHLMTLQAKAYLADWIRESGDKAAAIELLEAVLADGIRLLGEDHWLATGIRTELSELRSND